MKHDFQFKMNLLSVNVDTMKTYITQSKSGIMMNVWLSVKNQTIGALVKLIICGILARVIASVIEHANETYVDTKNCSCEKHLFVKLVSPCEGEILNTTETSSDDKKVTSAKK